MRSVVTVVRSVMAIVGAVVTVAVAMDAVTGVTDRVGIILVVILLHTSDIVRVVVTMRVAVRVVVAVRAVVTVTMAIDVVAVLVMGVRIRQVVLNLGCGGGGSEASKSESLEHFTMRLLTVRIQLVF